MNYRSGITVVIPTIAPRQGVDGSMLERAIKSVSEQDCKSAIRVAVQLQNDRDKEGAAITRQRGLDRVQTEWVAFLDDDDYLYPWHLRSLWNHAVDNDADYVYSWFDTNGEDPFPQHESLRWYPAVPVQTTITVLVRTELARSVGFVADGAVGVATPDGNRSGEDWAFTLGCMGAGARISHLIRRTWFWDHHGKNTSGLPERW